MLCSTLGAEHGGKILLLCVDLELVEGLAISAAHSVVGVNELLSLLELFVDTVIDSADFTLLKCFLGGAVAEQEVRLSAYLNIN